MPQPPDSAPELARCDMDLIPGAVVQLRTPRIRFDYGARAQGRRRAHRLQNKSRNIKFENHLP